MPKIPKTGIPAIGLPKRRLFVDIREQLESLKNIILRLSDDRAALISELVRRGICPDLDPGCTPCVDCQPQLPAHMCKKAAWQAWLNICGVSHPKNAIATAITNMFLIGTLPKLC